MFAIVFRKSKNVEVLAHLKQQRRPQDICWISSMVLDKLLLITP